MVAGLKSGSDFTTSQNVKRKCEFVKPDPKYSVNHSGDSDTTGSITGAILGTLLGVESIPGHWLRDVENSDRIKEIANDMFSIFKNGKKLSYEEYPPF